MNKKTMVVLFLLALIVLVACAGCYIQDKNGTPPSTRVPKLKIEVHGSTYLCNRYKLYTGGNLHLYECQGFGNMKVIINDVKDFQVTPYKPVPTPRG